MKQVLKWLGYVVLASQIFTLSIPLLDMTLRGYTLKYLLFYLMIFAVGVLWVVKKVRHNTVRISDLFLLALLVGPFVVGMVLRWPVRTILLEGIHMMMPIVIYQWVDLVDIKKENYTRFFAWVTIAAGIVSVLVALGFISTGIWTPEGNYVRSAGAVDSTIGVAAFCMAAVQLYIYPPENKKRKLLLTAMLLAAVATTVFSQSRTRIVLLAGLAAIVVLLSLFSEKSKRGTVRFLIFAAIITVVVLRVFPDVVEQILSQVSARFQQTSSEELNVSYRQQEFATQMRMFAESPIVGKGWGSRSAFADMYFHNIYSTLLMQGGLVFGGGYIIWIVSFLFRAVRNWYKKADTGSSVICTLLMVALIILGFTNGGMMQSSGYLAMAYLYIDEKQRRSAVAEERLPSNTGNANWNPNLSQSN